MADLRDELLALEHRAWQALATEGAAADFYDDVLADDVLMLLPGGLVIDDRTAVVDSVRGTPWSSFELSDERVLALGSAAVVAYRATAVREGVEYSALFATTWVREGERWRMSVHQQTPM